MSIYNASTPSAGDSKPTTKIKTMLKKWIPQIFQRKGYRCIILEEVPAHFENVAYNLDLGVLVKNKESFDEYRFFGIELDWNKGHNTAITDHKDRDKNQDFLSIGIPILRFFTGDFIGTDKLTEPAIENLINNFFVEELQMNDKEFIQRNEQIAQTLKENQLPTCRNSSCKHAAQMHSLTGCNFRYTNKTNLKCYCKEAFMVSNA